MFHLYLSINYFSTFDQEAVLVVGGWAQHRGKGLCASGLDN